jgi:hypothetical protein
MTQEVAEMCSILDSGRSCDVVVCFATRVEGEDLPRRVAERSLVPLRTGVGVVNAAVALTRFLTVHVRVR